MKRTLTSIGMGVCVAGTSLGAAAQSSVTIYGTVDEYLNYMSSSSGTKVKALEDGEFLRSRLGFKGLEDLGSGYAMKFQLETGLTDTTGATADTTRFFDRQSWVGLATPFGEVRAGRQNSAVFYKGDYVDYTTRTLGSMVNVFGVPSRYDNDLSLITMRTYGVQAEVHANLPESPSGNHPLVYQLGLDWKSDSFVVGYGGLRGRPPTNATVDKDVVYDNLFADWKFGQGTVYLAYVRSNNDTSSSVSNNAGAILGNTGGYNAGTNADLNHFYNIYQISADYRIADLLRVGALWGKIDDTSGRQRGASGGSIGAYYDLSKRTTLIGMVETVRNQTNGGWRPAGSAGLQYTFTNPNDINGRTLNGVQFGVVHRF